MDIQTITPIDRASMGVIVSPPVKQEPNRWITLFGQEPLPAIGDPIILPLQTQYAIMRKLTLFYALASAPYSAR
jgi:hypothetical protein